MIVRRANGTSMHVGTAKVALEFLLTVARLPREEFLDSLSCGQWEQLEIRQKCYVTARFHLKGYVRRRNISYDENLLPIVSQLVPSCRVLGLGFFPCEVPGEAGDFGLLFLRWPCLSRRGLECPFGYPTSPSTIDLPSNWLSG